ncbi:MAG: hypothetical protein Salg2KO_02680 [Salibacteraceae bacterium]
MSATANKIDETILQGREAAKVIPEADLIRYKSFSGVPAFIHFKANEQIGLNNWQQWMKLRYFKGQPNIGFTLVGTETDQLGMVHLRFKQTINGYPIESATWIVHSKDGLVISMNGELFDAVPNFSPSLTEAVALSQALSAIGANTYKWEIPAEEAHLKIEQDDQDATFYPKGELVVVNSDPSLKTVDLSLSWKFNIYAADPMSRTEVYIDAAGGGVVFENDLIHHADSNGTAVTGYSGTRPIVADYTGSEFRLREVGRGNGIETYTMNNGTNYGLASDYVDNDNFWNATGNDQYGTDAHWGAEMTYDYFFDNHSRNSIDDAGFKLLSYCSYNTNYSNAFWDGDRMTYGDGGAPFQVIDVVGHEISHGLTSNTANLVYSYESGALNESFSDIFGAAVEFDAEGVNNGDWLMGEDRGSAIRSLSNPGLYGDPNTYYGNNWWFGAGDNGGVHTNSGVQNFWYYLLVEGGSGTNDNGDTYSVTGLGLDDASAIAFRNLTVYLTTNSQYSDARFYAIQCAQDLFGACTQEVESTTNAWYAVGVGSEYVQGVTADFEADDTDDCNVPFTVDFSNLSINTDTYSWDFGDGNTSSTALPSHTYTTAGVYTVELTASSSCGTDTKTAVSYIEVGPSVPCDYSLPISGAGETQEGCTGNLFDNGGPDANYLANTDSWVTIAPCNAASVTLTFEQFFIEGGNGCPYDILTVYDGPSTTSPVLGTYCGGTLPSAITSTGPSVTVRMEADGGLEYAGFKITWECEEGNFSPEPEFEAPITEACDGRISFEDATTNCPDAWLWRFGDGTTSTDQNPAHTYDSNGVYDVTLIATNANGTDSIIKTAYIELERPTAPDGGRIEVCPEETATLYANPTDVGLHRWYDSPSATIPIATGDSFTTAPILTTTPFYVETAQLAPIDSVGPESNAIGGGAYFNNYQALIFDVYEPIILKTVTVFAEGNGNREIVLRDENGSALESKVVFLVDGEQDVDLNFDLPVGTDLSLGMGLGGNIDLYRNNEGVNYPYNFGNTLSITRSTANQNGGLDHYYFFYNWKVGDKDCISPRTIVNASTSVCTGILETEDSKINVFPNPNNGSFTISWESMDIDRLEIFSSDGQLIKSTVPQSNRFEETLSSGLYLLKFTNGNASQIKRVVVQ